MRRNTLLTLLVTPFFAFAQTADVVNTNPGYTQQVWYDLESGSKYTANADEWDIAFEMHGFSASIITNSPKPGFRLYEAPYAIGDWSNLDTAGITFWPQPVDAPENWSLGAFNHGADPADPFDLGWGDYDFVTHVVTGDSLYVVQLANGEFKKLKIDALSSGTYYFAYANLDGSNEVNATVDKMPYLDKGFVYYSIENDQLLDREPANTDWDLTFMQYTEFVPIEYGVTGVLLNKYETLCEEVAGQDVLYAQHSMQFDSARNVIGWDWKNFNMNTFQWEIADSLTYFISTQEGNIYSIVFTDFGGGATGEYFFNWKLVSNVGVDENSAEEISMYPNPAQNVLTFQLDNDTDIVITDMAGRIALQERTSNERGAYAMDISSLRSGMYMVGLSSNTGLRSTKLIVE